VNYRGWHKFIPFQGRKFFPHFFLAPFIVVIVSAENEFLYMFLCRTRLVAVTLPLCYAKSNKDGTKR